MTDLPELIYTPAVEIETIHKSLRNGFQSGKLKSIQYRKQQLLNLAYLVKDNAHRFTEAWTKDLGRSELESHLLEIETTLTEIMTSINGVDRWAKPEKPAFSLNWAATRPVIRKEPKGVVLIISPFNYSMWLSLGPYAGAIASGNAAVLKPSELLPTVSALMTELWPKYLDQDLFRIVNGGVSETTKLLQLQWNHILYTGSGRVGRIVAAAAGKQLTPVSLELGGKSPVVIDPKLDLKTAARRILWGKFVNSGQTCVAPDYVLVPSSFQEQFIKGLLEVHHEFYPTKLTPQNSVELGFTRIVSVNHAKRIKELLDNTKGDIVVGGETDIDERWIAPTIVRDCKADDSLMREEIFGPVLPVLPVQDVDEAIAFINARDHPLALYVFSHDSAFKNKVIENTQSGSVIANECILQCAADGLPFGGTGPSGSGYHTGKSSFDMFTHLRSSMDSPSWLDLIMGARYPPYTAKKLALLNKFMAAKLPPRDQFSRNASWWKFKCWLLLLLAAVMARLTKRAKLSVLSI